MKELLVAILGLLTAATAFAQDSLGNVRPAALAFSEKHPITYDTYVAQAKSYLIVKNKLIEKIPNTMRAETETRAREFSSFSAGLFATYSPEEILSCLSWQSFDDVVTKSAKLAVESKKVDYPMVSALVNLKFACLTKQETDTLTQAIRRNSPASESDKP